MIEPLQSGDALAAEIDRVATAPALNLWWLGQSGFLATCGERRILFDPYLSDALTRKYAATPKPHVRMSRQVIDPSLLRHINLITATHAHTDHLDAETLRALGQNNPAAKLVAPRYEQTLVNERWGGPESSVAFMSAGESQVVGDIGVAAVAAAHDRVERDADGNVRHLGFVIRIGRYRIYHSGDGVVFPGLAESVAALGPIDVAILPINGKVGNMDGSAAAGLAEAIGTRVAIPCHYDLFEFNTADPRELFAPACERIGQIYRILQLGERLQLD